MSYIIHIVQSTEIWLFLNCETLIHNLLVDTYATLPTFFISDIFVKKMLCSVYANYEMQKRPIDGLRRGWY